MSIVNNEAIWHAESFDSSLLAVTVGDLLDRQAEAFGDKEALVYAYPEIGLELRLTYSQLRDQANQIAKGLMALGVVAGNKVAVLATNVPEWVLLEMALPQLGAVLVTVNTNYQKDELEYLLRQADVHTLMLMKECRGNDFLRSLKSIVPELDTIVDPAREESRSEALPAFRHAVLIDGEATGVLPFRRLAELGQAISNDELARRQASVMPNDVSQIQFTSGTTGTPKGAMITHYGTINNARLVAQRARLTEHDRYVTAMPLFHTAGNVVDQLSMLATGGTIVKLLTFDAAKMLELIDRERGTVINAVPTMIIAMLQEPRFQAGEFDVSSLRQVITGGTPIPVSLMEEIKSKWGAEPTIVFGMTEASPIITQTLSDDSFDLRSATVGMPLPFTEVKIVDINGEVTAIGEPGEILIRGYNVMKGYYNMPEQTAKAIDPDGWLHSGDLASIDANGYVRIVGRIKDMFIRGGENIYPAEIESFLMRHPKISQVALIGVADAYLGEEGAAFVQLREGQNMTEDEIRDYCRTNLSRHKLPKYFRFVGDFPLTPSGKVKKFELRANLMRELRLDT